jgi:hypothetical protein
MIYIIVFLLLILVLANDKAREILGAVLGCGGILGVIGVVLIILLVVGFEIFKTKPVERVSPSTTTPSQLTEHRAISSDSPRRPPKLPHLWPPQTPPPELS